MNKKCFAVIFNTKEDEQYLGKLWLESKEFSHHTTQEIKIASDKVETEKCVYNLYGSSNLKISSFKGENFNGIYVCNSLRYSLDEEIMRVFLLSVRLSPTNEEVVKYI